MAYSPMSLNLNSLFDKVLYYRLFLFAIYLDDLIDFRRSNYSNFVILYADDITLLARSVCELQRMLTACEHELSWLDMSINSKKSCCIG